MSRHVCPAGFCALLVVSAGCGVDGLASHDPGSTIEGLPRVALVEDLRIGSVDDASYGFSQIGAVDVDRDGQIYVLEMQDAQIRVYSPDGRLIRRIGRRGDGPGEFRGGGPSFGVVGDTIWAVEGVTRRLTLFDRAGRLLTAARFTDVTVPWHVEGQAASVWPAVMQPGGLFISLAAAPGTGRYLGSESHSDTVIVPRVRFNPSGQVVDTIGFYRDVQTRPPPEFVEAGRSRYMLPRPPVGSLSRVTQNGRITVGWGVARSESGGEFEITWRDLADEISRTRTYHYRPARFTEAMLDGFATSATRTGSALVPAPGNEEMKAYPGDAAAGKAAIRSRMRFPEFQPAINAAHMGKDGSLWLRREDTGADTFRWVMIDPQGNPTGELHLPRNLRIVWSEAEMALAVWRDELDVPWLIRYRLTLSR